MSKENIAIITGGVCAIDELNQKVENFTLADLGVADKVIVTKDHTTIIHGVNKIAAEIDSSEELRNKIDIIKKKINPS